MDDDRDSMRLVEREARSGTPNRQRARFPSSSGMKDAARSVGQKVFMLLVRRRSVDLLGVGIFCGSRGARAHLPAGCWSFLRYLHNRSCFESGAAPPN